MRFIHMLDNNSMRIIQETCKTLIKQTYQYVAQFNVKKGWIQTIKRGHFDSPDE